MFYGAYNGQGLFAANNQISINASDFEYNLATSGGGISSFYENVLSLNDVTLFNNIASETGAAIDIDTSNTVSIISSTFDSNNVQNGDGGAVASKVQNIIAVNDSTFSNNSARSGKGGALWLDSGSKITFLGSNDLLHNSAEVGGALFGTSIPLWAIDGDLNIEGNEAAFGSAIALAFFSESGSVLTNITLTNNKASMAGTFFWLCSGPSCNEPTNQGLIFANNSAPYGNNFATQPTSIQSATEYNVTVYNRPLNPSISLYIYDFYGQLVISDNETVVESSVFDYSCRSFVGTLASSTVEVSKEGLTTFNDITAFCNPEGNLTIHYTAKPSLSYFDIADPSDYYVINASIWSFRNCQNGEKYLNGACVTCGNGTYSLQYKEDGICIRCPVEGKGCYANNIDLSQAIGGSMNFLTQS